ncbi:MAG: hypothetical protein GY868_18040 [Deltaproteobacteria bacterium]|nr:hypothetical protein [Deltaproteobacteria bacterium]
MKVFKLILKCCTLMAAVFLAIQSSALGAEFELAGRPFFINGFITQEGALGVDNSQFSGRNLSAYTTVQLEWEFKLNDNISLYGINRLFGDQAYNMHHDRHWFQRANSQKAQPTNARENMEWEWNSNDRGWEIFRELYVDIYTESFQFRIGRQQVIWGESDGLRLMDCINPQDMRYEFNLRDSDEGYEYTRIPLWLIKSTYFPKSSPFGIRDMQVEFIINPGKTKINRLELYGSDGGVWATETPNLPRGVRVNVEDKTHKTSLDKTEFAMRIMGNFKDWLFTLNGYYGYQQENTAILVPTGPTIGAPWDEAFLTLNFDKKFYHRKLLGFTLNKELTSIRLKKTTSPVLRVEALYEFDKPFCYEGNHTGDMAWTGLNPAFSQARKFKDQVRFMLGFDWQIYIRALNKRESFFVSSQFFLFYIRDKNGQFVNAPFYFTNKVKGEMMPPLPPSRDKSRIDPWRINQTQKYFSLLVNTYYDNKRIMPQIMYLADLNEKAHGLKAKICFNYGSHWRPEIGTMMWWGDHDTGKSFGLFQKNRQVYIKIKYQF